MFESMLVDLDLVRDEKIRPLSRREVDELGKLGAFGDERVELLHGVLVRMDVEASHMPGSPGGSRST